MAEDEEPPPRSAAASEILYELHEIRQALMRLERLMLDIALNLGVKP